MYPSNVVRAVSSPQAPGPGVPLPQGAYGVGMTGFGGAPYVDVAIGGPWNSGSNVARSGYWGRDTTGHNWGGAAGSAASPGDEPALVAPRVLAPGAGMNRGSSPVFGANPFPATTFPNPGGISAAGGPLSRGFAAVGGGGAVKGGSPAEQRSASSQPLLRGSPQGEFLVTGFSGANMIVDEQDGFAQTVNASSAQQEAAFLASAGMTAGVGPAGPSILPMVTQLVHPPGFGGTQNDMILPEGSNMVREYVVDAGPGVLAHGDTTGTQSPPGTEFFLANSQPAPETAAGPRDNTVGAGILNKARDSVMSWFNRNYPVDAAQEDYRPPAQDSAPQQQMQVQSSTDIGQHQLPQGVLLQQGGSSTDIGPQYQVQQGMVANNGGPGGAQQPGGGGGDNYVGVVPAPSGGAQQPGGGGGDNYVSMGVVPAPSGGAQQPGGGGGDNYVSMGAVPAPNTSSEQRAFSAAAAIRPAMGSPLFYPEYQQHAGGGVSTTPSINNVVQGGRSYSTYQYHGPPGAKNQQTAAPRNPRASSTTPNLSSTPGAPSMGARTPGHHGHGQQPLILQPPNLRAMQPSVPAFNFPPNKSSEPFGAAAWRQAAQTQNHFSHPAHHSGGHSSVGSSGLSLSQSVVAQQQHLQQSVGHQDTRQQQYQQKYPHHGSVGTTANPEQTAPQYWGRGAPQHAGQNRFDQRVEHASVPTYARSMPTNVGGGSSVHRARSSGLLHYPPSGASGGETLQQQHDENATLSRATLPVGRGVVMDQRAGIIDDCWREQNDVDRTPSLGAPPPLFSGTSGTGTAPSFHELVISSASRNDIIGPTTSQVYTSGHAQKIVDDIAGLHQLPCADDIAGLHQLPEQLPIPGGLGSMHQGGVMHQVEIEVSVASSAPGERTGAAVQEQHAVQEHPQQEEHQQPALTVVPFAGCR